MVSKRLFDLLFVIPGLVLLAPVFLIIAIWVKLDSKGPCLYKQDRIGKNGKTFKVFKFRTMEVDGAGPKLTVGNDPRITRFGKYLRRVKLDELPQLFNVLMGEMSLVGPRPQVQEHMAHYPEGIKEIVLSMQPGITDLASIKFSQEPELLARADDPLREYIDVVVPEKCLFYQEYEKTQTRWLDFKILLLTIRKLTIGR